MSFQDPRERYYIMRDAALDKGDTENADVLTAHAGLVERSPEEWEFERVEFSLLSNYYTYSDYFDFFRHIYFDAPSTTSKVRE